MTIVAEIKQDLKSRIQSQRMPERLTLAALSKHYGVSFTPVRAVVDELIREQYLLKQHNGRLAIGLRAGRKQTASEHRGSGRQRDNDLESAAGARSWESALTADIIQRSLRGDSDFLREEVTARRFALGRTSLRQAFSRLAGKGLLEHVPRCGWRVRAFSAVDLAAYLEARETLELKALDLARPRLVPDDLRRMLSGNLPAGQPARLDNQLHAYLIEKAENRYLTDFFERHGVYYTTLFDHAAPAAKVVADMARQHRSILRALIEKDWPRARRALSHHIRSQQPIIETLLAQLKAGA
jgi:DNA-binding GntR family transcriptional regulator